MSKIVFATFGSLGDVHPLLALALEMKARGHLVIFATSEWYRAKIEATGLGFAPLRPAVSPDDEQLIADLMDIKKGTERLLRGLLFPTIRDSYNDLLSATKNADLLVAGETIYAAPLVADKTRLRWVSTTLAPMSFFSSYDPPVFPPFPALAKLHCFGPRINRQIIRFARFYTRKWPQPLYDLRRELGLPRGRDAIYDAKYSPHRVLALFSSALGEPQPDWPRQTLQTGFAFYDAHFDASLDLSKSQQRVQEFLDAGAPPVIWTLGSAAVFDAGKFYEESVRAAKTLGCRALFLVGKNVLPDLPDSMLAIDYAPYSHVFSRAAAVVHQGGVGTTAQAMRAGVPQLVMPYSHDQPDNAARIVRSQLGLSIPRHEYSKESAVPLLRALLHDSKFKANATKIAQQIAEENGTQDACDAIERQLSKNN